MSSIMFLGVMVLLNQIEFRSLAENTRDQFSNRQQTVTHIFVLERQLPSENSTYLQKIHSTVQLRQFRQRFDLKTAILTQHWSLPIRRFRKQPNPDSEKLHTGQSTTLISDWSTILKPRLISRFVFPQQNPCSQLVMITHFSNWFLLQKDNWLLHVQTFKL